MVAFPIHYWRCLCGLPYLVVQTQAGTTFRYRGKNRAHCPTCGRKLHRIYSEVTHD